MRVVGFLTQPHLIDRILDHLRRHAPPLRRHAPPARRARAPAAPGGCPHRHLGVSRLRPRLWILGSGVFGVPAADDGVAALPAILHDHGVVSDPIVHVVGELPAILHRRRSTGDEVHQRFNDTLNYRVRDGELMKAPFETRPTRAR
jgi:hypothetical protein